MRGTEKVMRFLAHENRTRRRMLTRSLFEIMDKNPKTMKTARVIKPSRSGDPYYVFLLLPHPEGVSEEEYREGRHKFLSALHGNKINLSRCVGYNWTSY